MTPEGFKGYKKDNPYHVWVYRDDGSKFIGHFKNRAEAASWARRGKATLGTETTASHTRGHIQRPVAQGFGMGVRW